MTRVTRMKEAAETRWARERVQAVYPLAHTLPLGPGCGMRGFWIVTGTGYTLGLGRTMDEAWWASAKLVRSLVERDEREAARVERIKYEMGAVG
jgi:hypothetical protein